MTVTFLFDSMDDRQRAAMAVDTVDEAVEHVCKVMNGGRRRGPALWTFDEDGDEVPSENGFRRALERERRIKLFDQGSRNSSDTVTIFRIG